MSRKLKSRQVKAAILMADGMCGKEVARELGVRAETVSRWRQLPEFQQEMDKALGAYRERLQRIAVYAVRRSFDQMEQALQSQSMSRSRLEHGLSTLDQIVSETIVAAARQEMAGFVHPLSPPNGGVR